MPVSTYSSLEKQIRIWYYYSNMRKIQVSFLTNNSHKFIEAREALAQYPSIDLKQIIEGKAEYKDDTLSDPVKEIAKKAAEEAVKSMPFL
jgi:inosine/xanthosine triphosphate pyrophosphatase family protein